MHLKQKHSWQSTCLQLPIFQPRLSKTTSPLLRGILTWKKISTYRKTISLNLTSLTDPVAPLYWLSAASRELSHVNTEASNLVVAGIIGIE